MMSLKKKETYVYMRKKNKIWLATTEGKKYLDGDQSNEIEKFRDVLNDNDNSKNTDSIYEQAVKFNLVPKLRDITKPLSEWKGYDPACYKECETTKQNKHVYKNCKKDCNESNDFFKWNHAFTSIDINNRTEIIANNIAEVMAVLSQAARNTIFKEKYYPRPVQLLALFALFIASNNLLAQISTGEGKSIIAAMYVVIKVMLGIDPDIVTSVNELAQRDASDFKVFYAQFGISVDHNTASRESLEAKGKRYQNNVIYGDVTNHCADRFWDISANVKQGRSSGFLIADEADALTMDQFYWSVLLATPIPGFEILNQLFTTMYSSEQSVAVTLEKDTVQDQCFFRMPASNVTQQENSAAYFNSSNNEKENQISNQTSYALPIGPCAGRYLRL